LVNIELADLIEIVLGNMAEFSDSGEMVRSGATFFETPTELTAIYDTVAVPYIIYQEEGFTHWISGKFIDKNKGFISTRANNKIQRFVFSEQIGEPYNKLANDQTLLEDRNKMLVELGAIKDV